MPPIPITILTGFLGSGKTTLLLNLLPQLPKSYRLALLKNEFGDVAIDSQLASTSSIAGVRELLNGCICCNLVGSLSSALQELATTLNPPPDRIVIETSGSAFPATLAMEVNRVARETGGGYVLDGVVSVIDVENWKGIAWVKSLKGWVDVSVILGIDGGLARQLGEEQSNGHVVDSEANGHDHHGHGHDHANGENHQEEVEVLSVTLSAEDPGPAFVDTEALSKLLKLAPKDEVYRIKAVLTTSSPLPSSEGSPSPSASETSPSGGRYILNWAFGRWTSTAVKSEGDEHESTNGLVLRMTLILARYESNKWKKRIETGGFVQLEGVNKGSLTVEKIA
ncbi:hypothetical protein B7463_g1717, partial [Scytalidium lignicola]